MDRYKNVILKSFDSGTQAVFSKFYSICVEIVHDHNKVTFEIINAKQQRRVHIVGLENQPYIEHGGSIHEIVEALNLDFNVVGSDYMVIILNRENLAIHIDTRNDAFKVFETTGDRIEPVAQQEENITPPEPIQTAPEPAPTPIQATEQVTASLDFKAMNNGNLMLFMNDGSLAIEVKEEKGRITFNALTAGGTQKYKLPLTQQAEVLPKPLPKGETRGRKGKPYPPNWVVLYNEWVSGKRHWQEIVDLTGIAKTTLFSMKKRYEQELAQKKQAHRG